MNIPILITLIRLAAIPVVVVLFYLPFSWAHPAASVVFVIAALSDWLDGYLARSLHQTTRFGAFLDPVADKVLVVVTLVIIAGEHKWFLMPLAAAVIIAREVIISALREWMAELGKRTSVAVNWVGKVKTGLQMTALVVLLWYSPYSPWWVLHIGRLLLVLAAALTLWSMVIYVRLAWPDLMQGLDVSDEHKSVDKKSD